MTGQGRVVHTNSLSSNIKQRRHTYFYNVTIPYNNELILARLKTVV